MQPGEHYLDRNGEYRVIQSLGNLVTYAYLNMLDRPLTGEVETKLRIHRAIKYEQDRVKSSAANGRRTNAPINRYLVDFIQSVDHSLYVCATLAAVSRVLCELSRIDCAITESDIKGNGDGMRTSYHVRLNGLEHLDTLRLLYYEGEVYTEGTGVFISSKALFCELLRRGSKIRHNDAKEIVQ